MAASPDNLQDQLKLFVTKFTTKINEINTYFVRITHMQRNGDVSNDDVNAE